MVIHVSLKTTSYSLASYIVITISAKCVMNSFCFTKMIDSSVYRKRMSVSGQAVRHFNLDVYCRRVIASSITWRKLELAVGTVIS